MTHLSRYTCEQVFRRMDEYLDRELRAVEAELVRQHLETCAACAHEFAFESSVLEELRTKLRRVDLPATLRDSIAGKLAAARAAERGAAGPIVARDD